MVYLFLSFILINILHGYLLFSNPKNRGLTISEHAAATNTTHLFYIIGHFLGGAFFLIFAYQIFYLQYQSSIILAVALVGVITEWLQSIVPARNRYIKHHTVLAVLMSLGMVILSILCAVMLPLDEKIQNVIIAIALIMTIGYPGAVLLPRKYFWIIEIVNINLFYLQMFILLLTV